MKPDMIVDIKNCDAYKKLEAENARLKDILREIRDLACTGLKPDIYPTEEIWLQHKINWIASMAHAILEKEPR